MTSDWSDDGCSMVIISDLNTALHEIIHGIVMLIAGYRIFCEVDSCIRFVYLFSRVPCKKYAVNV